MIVFNGFEKVVSSVVDIFDNVGVMFSVGSLYDNDFVKIIGFFEVVDIFVEMFNVSYGSFSIFDKVVGMVFLVGSNEVRVVNGR